MSDSERSERNYKLVPNVSKLHLDEETADVVFTFKNNGSVERISAHKCLLAAGSVVFKRMFFGELKEDKAVPIVDVSIEGFVAFLQYFYLDVVTYNANVIAEVMQLADKYDAQGCFELCTRYLTMTMSTQNIEPIVWCYELALLFDLAHLIGVCEEKICLETHKVLDSESFLSCSWSTLGRILLIEKLSCNEKYIFQACMNWAVEACKRAGIDENNAENLKLKLGKCFDSIRFPTMSAEDFYFCISEKENILSNNEIMDILSHLTLHRPLQVWPQQAARQGVPVWVKDNSVQICDRRTLPNLCRRADVRQDFLIFSVNERILMGELAISSFGTVREESEAITRTGELTVRKLIDAGNSPHSSSPKGVNPTVANEIQSDLILQQRVTISNASSKVQLTKPLIIQPFQLYEIETKWDVEDGEQLILRTECHEEVMLDGGVRFQFTRKADCSYDNVAEGLISRLYFKQW